MVVVVVISMMLRIFSNQLVSLLKDVMNTLSLIMVRHAPIGKLICIKLQVGIM